MPIVIFLIIFAFCVALAMIGYRRIREGYWADLIAMVSILLSATSCWLVATSKTGYFLAGLLGFAMMFLMLMIAGSIAFGGRLGCLSRWLSQQCASCGSRTGGFWTSSLIRKDMILVLVFALLAILISVMESGGSGGGHY
ncbi:MAG: hypothetical protein ACK5II_09455 [Paracoccus sp. (in: a-proteobacteria)]